MAEQFLSILASGASFGAALTASCVWLPSVIDAQVHFQSFHMMKVFLTATATSAVAILTLDRIGLIHAKPKGPINWGWLGRYDGNVVGGIVMGIGMTLAKACPGTVFVQAAMGYKSGLLALAGAAIGGILFARFENSWKSKAQRASPEEAPCTLQEKLQVDANSVLLGFEACIAAMLALATGISPHRSILFHPVIGGLLVGCGQLTTLLLTKRPVGVSSAYREMGQWFWYLRSGHSKSEREAARPPINSMIFAVGILVGSATLVRVRPGLHFESPSELNPIRAVLGGSLLAIGARLGGGCTSGHGISGMAQFSVASVISVTSMFAGAFAAATLV